MEPFSIDILAPWCWPIIALGLTIGIGFFRVKDRIGPISLVLLALLIVAMVAVPPFFILVEANQTVMMMANFELLILMFGVAVFWALPRRRKKDPVWRTAAVVLMGTCATAFGVWSLVGDFLLPHGQLVGHITKSERYVPPRGIVEYRVWIEGERFRTTAEIYDRVHPGDLVRAEIGHGTQVVLRIEAL